PRLMRRALGSPLCREAGTTEMELPNRSRSETALLNARDSQARRQALDALVDAGDPADTEYCLQLADLQTALFGPAPYQRLRRRGRDRFPKREPAIALFYPRALDHSP